MTAEEETIYDVKEASQFLHVKEQTLYQYKAAGKIPFHKVGGKLVFFKSELIKWVKSN